MIPDSKELIALVDGMEAHLPGYTRRGVGGYTASTDQALQLPIEPGMCFDIRYALGDVSVGLRCTDSKLMWPSIEDNNLAYAICKCWLAWKDAQDDG